MNFPTQLSLLAQADPGQGGGANFFAGPLPMFLILGVMFYFLLIRPQQRQRKELAARIASMTPGDKVISAGGIHGLIHNVKDKTVVIKVAEGTMLEFEKTSITTVIKKDAAAN